MPTLLELGRLNLDTPFVCPRNLNTSLCTFKKKNGIQAVVGALKHKN